MHRQALSHALASGPQLLPGVWDPLSALLARQAGFEAAFVSGFAVAGSLLGLPDTGHLTQTDMADVARRICAAVPDVAVLVDADTGYGNDATAARTASLWAQAGAAGMFLEDQVWPKRCGHMEGKEVVAKDDWLAKLVAARSAAPELFLVARTDARAPHGLDEAIARGKAAADLGVDAVFVEAPRSTDEMQQVAAALPGVSLVANMVEFGKTPLLTPDELHELGFDLVISPLTGLLSATSALAEAYAGLRNDGTRRDHLDAMTPFDDFTAVVGLEH